MQESASMHKSPTPVRYSRMNQAREEEEEKERKRDRKDRGHSRMNQAREEEEEKERKRDRKDRGQEADGKKGSPTKQIWGTKQGLPRHSKAYLGTAKVKQGLPRHSYG